MHSLRVIDKIYGMLVNRVPGIRERYRRMRLRSKGIRRGTAWLYLLYLNIAYYIFRCRSLGELQKYPYYEEKILYTKGSESSLSRRQTPEEFAEELAAYDVISLDVFDTLVFRPFSAPADVFFVLEEELGYMDFKRIRMEMEWKARREKYESRGHYEINLEEIYTVLSRETGIDKEKTMKREVELEEEYCFANPYMYKVVEKLREKKARIVVTSDMYLNADQMEHLLRKCGYGTFDAYYVSCDAEKSKSQGTLYEEVKKQEKAFAGENLTFVHVGDNPVSDIRQAKKHGFAVRYYRNVNDAGRPYRPEDMSAITGSIYRGVVNAHIHNG